MAKIEIKINGEAYPCRPTMRAMLRFKEQTGKEITELDTNSFTDLCTYLWCCIKSACAREQKQFDLSLIEFADSIDPDDMNAWAAAVQAENGGEAPATDPKA